MDLVCIGWALVGIEVDADTDSIWNTVFDGWEWVEVDSDGIESLWDTVFYDWGWVEVDLDEDWFEAAEKPEGTEGAETELGGGIWESEGAGATKGGDRSGLRLK